MYYLNIQGDRLLFKENIILKINDNTFEEIAVLEEYVKHFNIHYTTLLRRYHRFVEIDEPMNDDISVSTFFDMIIVQLRAMCIENARLKDNYTAQILLRKIGEDELANRIDAMLEQNFIDGTDMTVKKAIKILADGFICHYDNFDGSDVGTWGMALVIENRLRNRYNKINLKYIMGVLMECIGEGFELE